MCGLLEGMLIPSKAPPEGDGRNAARNGHVRIRRSAGQGSNGPAQLLPHAQVVEDVHGRLHKRMLSSIGQLLFRASGRVSLRISTSKRTRSRSAARRARARMESAYSASSRALGERRSTVKKECWETALGTVPPPITPML